MFGRMFKFTLIGHVFPLCLGHSIAKWQLFSRSGFDLSKTFESPSNEGIYLMLQGSHYSPILEIKYNQSSDSCIYYDNGSKLDTS